MVVRISDKTQNYSKVTKLLVKPGFLSFEIFNSIYAKNDKKKIGIGIVVGVVIYILLELWI